MGPCQIGAFSYVGHGSKLYETSIGRYCSIASNVLCGPVQHPTDRFSSHLVAFDGCGPFRKSADFAKVRNDLPFSANFAKTIIGNDVWIGANATIMRGVTIGDGAIIGAGAVVTSDVPPYAIVVGVPGKVLRYRFDADLIARLQLLDWWRYDLSGTAVRDLMRMDAADFVREMELLKEKGHLRLLTPAKEHFTRSPLDHLPLRIAYLLLDLLT